MPARKPTDMDDFLFDLNGFLVLEHAVDDDLLKSLNSEFDNFPRTMARGDWYRGAQRRDYTNETGFELHQAVAAGKPFEELIDHPSWFALVTHYAGEEESYARGIFIDETIASIRASGGHHPAHSGGFRGALRGRYDHRHGVFRCAQVNIILALTDIGPGDGPTMVVPASHKSNLPHPRVGDYKTGDRMDELPGAVEVHLRKGDALLFVDGLIHGGSSRTNPGERRILIYRYGPKWGASRFGYQYDAAWLQTLTPGRRKVLQPVPPVRVGDPIKAG